MDPKSLGINLNFNKDSKQVIVDYSPTTKAISQSIVQNILKHEGYGRLYFLENNYEKLHLAYKTKKPCKILIAEARNAMVEIYTSHDNMRAYLNITQPYAGNTLTEEEILHAIEQSTIKVNLNQQVIKDSIDKGIVSHIMFAEGKYPRDKKQWKFENLLPIETGKYLQVTNNDELMRRSKVAVDDGIDVAGKPVKANPTVVVDFTKTNSTKVSPRDENILIATKSGHPVMIKHGMHIDNTLRVNQVSLATGNIFYDGSIYVKEDVNTGMQVEATGDIFVNGIVGAATLAAGGNIYVANGVIGGAAILKKGEHTGQPKGAKLKANGCIEANFYDNTDIQAGSDVIARDHACHSNIVCSGKVIIGTSDEARGCLIGGTTQARAGITAKTIGSSAYIKTELRIAPKKEVMDEYLQLTTEIIEKDEEYQDLSNTLARTKDNIAVSYGSKEASKLEFINHKLTNDQSKLMVKIDSISKKRQPLLEIINTSIAAKITISNQTFTGVIAKMQDQELKITKNTKGCVFAYEDYAITTTPYSEK